MLSRSTSQLNVPELYNRIKELCERETKLKNDCLLAEELLNKYRSKLEAKAPEYYKDLPQPEGAACLSRMGFKYDALIELYRKARIFNSPELPNKNENDISTFLISTNNNFIRRIDAVAAMGCIVKFYPWISHVVSMCAEENTDNKMGEDFRKLLYALVSPVRHLATLILFANELAKNLPENSYEHKEISSWKRKLHRQLQLFDTFECLKIKRSENQQPFLISLISFINVFKPESVAVPIHPTSTYQTTSHVTSKVTDAMLASVIISDSNFFPANSSLPSGSDPNLPVLSPAQENELLRSAFNMEQEARSLESSLELTDSSLPANREMSFIPNPFSAEWEKEMAAAISAVHASNESERKEKEDEKHRQEQIKRQVEELERNAVLRKQEDERREREEAERRKQQELREEMDRQRREEEKSKQLELAELQRREDEERQRIEAERKQREDEERKRKEQQVKEDAEFAKNLQEQLKEEFRAEQERQRRIEIQKREEEQRQRELVEQQHREKECKKKEREDAERKRREEMENKKRADEERQQAQRAILLEKQRQMADAQQKLEEQKRKHEEELKRKDEERKRVEAQRKQQEEIERQRREAEERKRVEAQRKQREDEERKRLEEEERKRVEAQRKQREDEERQRHEEEERKRRTESERKKREKQIERSKTTLYHNHHYILLLRELNLDEQRIASCINLLLENANAHKQFEDNITALYIFTTPGGVSAESCWLQAQDLKDQALNAHVLNYFIQHILPNWQIMKDMAIQKAVNNYISHISQVKINTSNIDEFKTVMTVLKTVSDELTILPPAPTTIATNKDKSDKIFGAMNSLHALSTTKSWPYVARILEALACFVAGAAPGAAAGFACSYFFIWAPPMMIASIAIGGVVGGLAGLITDLTARALTTPKTPPPSPQIKDLQKIDTATTAVIQSAGIHYGPALTA